MHLLALLSLFTTEITDFPTLAYTSASEIPIPFHDLMPEKGISFGRSHCRRYPSVYITKLKVTLKNGAYVIFRTQPRFLMYLGRLTSKYQKLNSILQ